MNIAVKTVSQVGAVGAGSLAIATWSPSVSSRGMKPYS